MIFAGIVGYLCSFLCKTWNHINPSSIHRGVTGWGTVLQAGMSRVLFLMGWLGFFIEITFPGPTQPLTQRVLAVSVGGVYCRFVRLKTLWTSFADWPEILGTQPPGDFTGLYRDSLTFFTSKLFQSVQNKKTENSVSMNAHPCHLSTTIM
jgi:hypothetical protein